ncbi:MAG: hypothetical protein ACLUI7_10395 [Coprococcus sp.]
MTVKSVSAWCMLIILQGRLQSLIEVSLSGAVPHQYAFGSENGLNLGFNPLNLFFGLLDTLLNSQICKDAIKSNLQNAGNHLC